MTDCLTVLQFLVTGSSSLVAATSGVAYVVILVGLLALTVVRGLRFGLGTDASRCDIYEDAKNRGYLPQTISKPSDKEPVGMI